MARPTCPSRGLVRLVPGGNVERLERGWWQRSQLLGHPLVDTNRDKNIVSAQ